MITQFEVSGSHYEVGYAIGTHFADSIQQAYDTYPLLRDLRAYHQTDAAQARYADMLAVHQDRFPQYMQELQGMADGAKRDLVDVLLVNWRGEYRGFMTEADDLRGCADCSILTDKLALIGHNEDGAPAFRKHMYFIHATVANNAKFTACSYPGFLCGNAFGFNTHGICYSIDNIRPNNIRVGVGRHFLARSLLDATSLDDAIQRVTVDGRASGFSYTIGSISERRIMQVEVMPDQHHIRDIQQVNFHANHVLDIESVSQHIDISSAERVKSAEAIFQRKRIGSSADILEILGDDDHDQYPIYRTATAPDVSETFCTALFDLDKREMLVYTGHPVRQAGDVMRFPITVD